MVLCTVQSERAAACKVDLYPAVSSCPGKHSCVFWKSQCDPRMHAALHGNGHIHRPSLCQDKGRDMQVAYNNEDVYLVWPALSHLQISYSWSALIFTLQIMLRPHQIIVSITCSHKSTGSQMIRCGPKRVIGCLLFKAGKQVHDTCFACRF